jgi:hypothetical protein
MSICYTKQIRAVLVVVFIAAMALVCGCVSDTPSNGSAGTPAPTEMKPTGQATGAGVIHYTILWTYLPTANNNWLSFDPIGETDITEDGYPYTHVAAVYVLKSNTDVMVTVGIEDSGGDPVGYWEDWDAWYEYEDIEYSWKKTEVNGYPAWDFHDKFENIYIRYIGIDDRFIVYIISDGEDYITSFTNAMDLEDIAALGKTR